MSNIKLNDFIDLKSLLEDAVELANKRSEDTFKIISNSKQPTRYGALVGSLVELYVLTIAQEKYPNLDIKHPDDDCHLGDIYSSVVNNGIELKFTLGWNNGQTSWSQGSVQEHYKDFLFVKGNIENGKLFIDYAYFGYMSYKDWRIHGKGMSIGPEKVREFCKRII